MTSTRGAQFMRFCIPVVEVLKELGGSGQSKEVTDLVLERQMISEDVQKQTLKRGGSRVRNQVGWARYYLAKSDWIDSSRRGVWALTERGRTTTLSKGEVIRLVKEVRASVPTSAGIPADTGDDFEDFPPADASANPPGTSTLLDVLRSLSPAGFERIAQRLLRESGFERVNVTGRSGDEGIDGNGILQINAFVSFTVLFQCKRYAGAVTSPQIRDFRGAMQGRADKGIIITTGTFTTDATKEARRDGAPPIELVDGEMLVRLFERLELGVRPRTVYEVDDAFFDEYREPQQRTKK